MKQLKSHVDREQADHGARVAFPEGAAASSTLGPGMDIKPSVHRAEGNSGASVMGNGFSLPKSEVGGVKTRAGARKTSEPVER